MDTAVVFDMDGTLFNTRNEVIGGEKTIGLLTQLQDAGVTMGICTGRLDHDIIRAGKRFNLSFHDRISQHGAVMVTGHRMMSNLLDKEEGYQILNFVSKHKLPVRVELNTVSNRYWMSDRDPEFPKELYDSHIIQSDYSEVIECQPAVLFLLIGELKDLLPIKEWADRVLVKTQAVISSANSLELMARDVSKGQAIEQLYSGKEVYAIGDAQNDFDMYRVAEQGYLLSDIECEYDVIRKPTIKEALQDIVERLLI